MSVLYDALKKLENQRKLTPPASSYESPAPVVASAPAVAAGPAVILGASAVVAAFIAIGIYMYQTGWIVKKAPFLQDVTGSDSATYTPKESVPTPPPSALIASVKERAGAKTASIKAPIATVVKDPKAESLKVNASGMELFRNSRYKDAVLDFKEAVNLDPSNPIPYNNMGLAYLWLGDKSEGEGAFKKALAINPEYPEALNNYGALLDRFWAGKRDGEAKGYFKRSMVLDPDYADPYLNMAILLERQGKYSRAATNYDGFLNRGGSGDSFNKAIRKKTVLLRSRSIY